MDFDDLKTNTGIEELSKLKNSLANSAESWARISASINETNRIKREKEARQIEALEQTAKNTGETKERLDVIIDNQNDYIKLLKQQLESQNEQCNLLKQQIDIIINIFATSENAKEYEKEMFDLLKEEIKNKNSANDFIKNVGENVIANGITYSIPILYNVFKKFLLSKGIQLP